MFRYLVLALLAIGFKASLHAMVVVPAEFGEMVAASQTIIHGRVLDVQSYETAGRRTIESLVTVQVVEAIKGQPGSTVVLQAARRAGGSLPARDGWRTAVCAR